MVCSALGQERKRRLKNKAFPGGGARETREHERGSDDMDLRELYRRRAHDCARLRAQARTELAKRRLEREWADWLQLAHGGEDRRRQTWRFEGGIEDGALI